MSFDVIILGLGAMGSAAAHHLAARGQHVLGLDQFTPPHDRGSSHGGSRIIRQAYFESPDYIPLVLRAYELWREIERDTGIRLIHTTGGLVIGNEDGDLVRRTIASAKEHHIPIDVLAPAELAARFPAFSPHPGDLGVFEHLAGYLVPEDCIRAQLQSAIHSGAQLHFDEKVLSWTAAPDHVEVATTRGSYSARHLIITAGPWAAEALQSNLPLSVTRQVTAWIQPKGGVEGFLPDRFPVFIAEGAAGKYASYGFPAIDGPNGGIKVAIHGSDLSCTPDTVDRQIHDADVQQIIVSLQGRIPAIAGDLLRAKTCLYTMTPDEHFIIGPHPRLPSCTIACGFSGHGFKFAPVIGEILAGLATRSSSTHPIALFSPERFAH
ncbi:N-methyl-L-tryptophan oxidase [Occallatibacter savannae]|uniref:N-methyl-L-tryptophan oxidase n=1 Tax=Occallatibacter savannae TaxID=1002691 RepID=UPI000D68ED99|nr:N-methyl-L-tryptophan oxidase [Occallatibacter savannae]